MEMDNPRPVRFRVVLELIFPDADPWDPSDYDKPLAQMKTALESAPNVNCKEVMIREATTIGDDDNYEVWRGGWKYDFSSLSPNTGYLFGAGAYPVPAVNPADLGRVWEVLSKAEAGEEDRNSEQYVDRTHEPSKIARSVKYASAVFFIRRYRVFGRALPAGPDLGDLGGP